MKIAVAKLRENLGAELEFEWIVPRKYIDVNNCDCKIIGDIIVKGKLINGGEEIAMEAITELTADYECSRCLIGVRRTFVVDIFESYAREKTEDHGCFDGDFVDISAAVCESVMLEMPMVVLCDDECKGICANCGANLNMSKCICCKEVYDARWQALHKLKLS